MWSFCLIETGAKHRLIISTVWSFRVPVPKQVSLKSLAISYSTMPDQIRLTRTSFTTFVTWIKMNSPSFLIITSKLRRRNLVRMPEKRFLRVGTAISVLRSMSIPVNIWNTWRKSEFMKDAFDWSKTSLDWPTRKSRSSRRRSILWKKFVTVSVGLLAFFMCSVSVAGQWLRYCCQLCWIRSERSL